MKRFLKIKEEDFMYYGYNNRYRLRLLWYFMAYILNIFFWKIPFLYHRIICKVIGCKIHWLIDDNLPPSAWYKFCDRCGAIKSNYEPNTEYKIIEGSDIIWIN